MEKHEELEQEEQVKPLVDEGDIDKHPSFQFIPKGHHDWKQEGFYLVCRSCDLDHAVWVGKDYMLVGIREDGMPLIKTRSSLGFL
jgi:hypothetical protein